MNRKNRKEEIFELQTMLRTLSQVNGNIPLVNPDGIFGEQTENAVTAFQKSVGLPPSGIVDYVTWDAIYESYLAASRAIALHPIQPFPSGRYETHRGEKSDTVLFIQLVLSALAVAMEIFEEIEPSGVYDEKTETAVMEFQKQNHLSPSGLVDHKTWNALARQYGAIVGNDLYGA